MEFESVDRLAVEVGNRMVQQVDANVRLYVDVSDFEHVFERIFNWFIGDRLPKWEYTRVYEQTFAHDRVQEAMEVIKELIREYVQDHGPVLVTYQDILHYYDLRISDFVGVR